MEDIHLNEAESEIWLLDARSRFEADRTQVQRGHTFGHTDSEPERCVSDAAYKPNELNEFWCARRGSNSRPNDSKSFALSN